MLSRNGCKNVCKIIVTVILGLVLAMIVLLAASLSHAQDDTVCHDDEAKVNDARGGYKCVPKVISMEWPAKDCIKDFKPNENTKLIVPLDYQGNPDFTKARLENFEFKMVCPVVKQGGTR
jgi:hypothetical protein